MSPAWMPVTRDPTAVITEPARGATGPPGARSRNCSTSGSSTTRKPSTFALIQPGLSTTATSPSVPSPAADNPVTS